MTNLYAYSLLVLLFSSIAVLSQEQEINQKFSETLQLKWSETFFDSGRENWQGHWLLEGDRATVKNTPSGMVFSAGPIKNDNGSHAVLWTKQNFEGDVKIEFDYTRMDDINSAVNILYIQATGTGDIPYTKDITAWSDLRIVPYMQKYFSHMNLLHISYAAYPLDNEKEKADYVRARRYPVKYGEKFTSYTALSPNYENTGLFKPGVKYHFIVVKRQDDLFMKVENEDIYKLFYWNTARFPAIIEGRIGIRHMWTRSSKYANFQVFVSK